MEPLSIHHNSHEGPEQFDRVIDGARELNEAWKNRDVFPGANFQELYVRGELAMHFHIGGERLACVDLRQDPLVDRLRGVETGVCEHQKPVLITVIQIRNDLREVIVSGGVVARLQSLDECNRSHRRPTVYLSFAETWKILGMSADRKLDASLLVRRGQPLLRAGEMCRNDGEINVVKRGPEIVNHFPDSNRDVIRDDQATEVKNGGAIIAVFAEPDGKLRIIEKRYDPCFEISDVLIGAFNLRN